MMRWLINNRILTGAGAVKVILSENYKTDPLMQQQISDLERTIAAVESQLTEHDNTVDSLMNENAQAEDLRISLKSLQENAEIVDTRGFTVDKVAVQDLYISLDNINDISDYMNSNYIAQAFYLSKAEYKERFGEDATSTTHTETDTLDVARKDKVCVYEVWDKKRRLCYTIQDGKTDSYLVEPYSPVTSERFYPFFIWVGDIPPLDQFPYCEATALVPLQREENERRGRINQIRSKFRPTIFYSKHGDLDKNDIENMLEAQEGDSIDAIGLPLTQSTIADQVWEAQRPSYDSNVFDSSDIYRDVEAVMRAGQANMGGMMQPKTATEANILNSTYQAGVSDHQDALENVVSEVFLHVIEVIAQRYTHDEIVYSTDDDEAIQFPHDMKELYGLINIRVKAGSLVKPDKAKRVETWGMVSQALMQYIQMIMQAVQAGDFGTAKLTRKIAEEHVKRADETLDPDEYLPNLDELEQQQMQQQQQQMQDLQQQNEQMQGQMQQAQEQMQAMQQENEQLAQLVQQQQPQPLPTYPQLPAEEELYGY
jgi:regulator of replication initiation timing